MSSIWPIFQIHFFLVYEKDASKVFKPFYLLFYFDNNFNRNVLNEHVDLVCLYILPAYFY